MSEILRVSRDGVGHLTYNQLRSKRFRAPLRGVRVTKTETEVGAAEFGARLALAAARPGAVLCDVSAAAWWGLPLPPFLIQPDVAVGLAVPPTDAAPRHRMARGRRLELPPDHIVQDRDCFVTTPARTWVDCAAMLRDEDLLAMGDAGLRMGLFDDDALGQMVTWAYRRRGVAHARFVRPLLNGLAESPGESRVRFRCIAAGLPAPECQIHLRYGGQFVARLDMGWRAERVALEYDGIVHLPEAQRRKDALRRNRIQEAGWRLLVVTIDDLRNSAPMIHLIRQALDNPIR
jgi:hypothetical protein